MQNPCPECVYSGSVQCQPYKCESMLAYQEANRYSAMPAAQSNGVKRKRCTMCRDFKLITDFEMRPTGRTRKVICKECSSKLNDLPEPKKLPKPKITLKKTVKDTLEDLAEVEQLAKARMVESIPSIADEPEKNETTKEVTTKMPEQQRQDMDQYSDDFIIEQLFQGYTDALKALQSRAKESVRTVGQQIVFEMKCLADGIEIYDPSAAKRATA